jgi:hypothetical protein
VGEESGPVKREMQVGCGGKGKKRERETGLSGENWPNRVRILSFFYFKFFSNS